MSNRVIKFRVWYDDGKSKGYCNNLERDFFPFWGGHLDNPPMGFSWKASEDIYTIEQFTGLLDKNGKEIYEGDILERKWEYCGDKFVDRLEVLFTHCPQVAGCTVRENGFDRIRSMGKDFEYTPYKTNNEIKSSKCEIIGNIHENPELLTNVTP